MRKRSPLSITGIGTVSAAGVGVSETAATFFDGLPSPGLTDPGFFKLPLREEWFHRFDFSKDGLIANLLALVATDEALNSAGWKKSEFSDRRVGVCLGSTIGGTNFQPEFNWSHSRNLKPDGAPLYQFFHNNTAQYLARFFGCRGPVQMISNACTSGADAIGIAATWLDADLCDAVICGGTETILPHMFYGFRSLQLCSSEPCRPFDKNRKGLTLGDGAGILLLEKPASSRPAKAHFLGFGSGSDALHPTSPHPEALGLQLATDVALTQAGCTENDIAFINAHGTATFHNDLAEGRWSKRRLPNAKIVATKGYTGHTLAAAGAIEAVFTVLSLMKERLPPSRGFHELDSEIGCAPTAQILSGDFTTALSVSLGFGGTNAVLCLARPT